MMPPNIFKKCYAISALANVVLDLGKIDVQISKKVDSIIAERPIEFTSTEVNKIFTMMRHYKYTESFHRQSVYDTLNNINEKNYKFLHYQLCKYQRK